MPALAKPLECSLRAQTRRLIDDLHRALSEPRIRRL
jgi:hypothetical protein